MFKKNLVGDLVENNQNISNVLLSMKLQNSNLLLVYFETKKLENIPEIIEITKIINNLIEYDDVILCWHDEDYEVGLLEEIFLQEYNGTCLVGKEKSRFFFITEEEKNSVMKIADICCTNNSLIDFVWSVIGKNHYCFVSHLVICF